MQRATVSWLEREAPRLDLATCRGQFVLSRARADLPQQWKSVEGAGWYLAVNDLPIHTLMRGEQFLGWCIGHPLGERAVELDPDDIEAFYTEFAGPWALLLVGLDRLLLDPGGQIPIVYATDAAVAASTPTLIACAEPRDLTFEQDIGFPDRDGWFPFGLTSRPNIRRLLPNHSLNLERWSVARHWPTPTTDLAIHTAKKPLVASICSDLTRAMRLARQQHPLEITVTGGHDSRMALACARPLTDDARFFTYAAERETCDVHVARRLARAGRFEHRFIPIIEASASQAQKWLERTGHAACGGIMRIHPSLTQADASRVLVTGMGGEVGRGYYYRRGDFARQPMNAALLLQRLGLPLHARLLEAGAHWLKSLGGYDAFVILDMLYLENRLGCWAAPQRFSNLTSKFEMTPFVQRRVIVAMLRLPRYFRWRNRLSYAVMRQAWPRLRRVPVNRFTKGWRGMRDSMVALVKATAGPIRYRGGDL